MQVKIWSFQAKKCLQTTCAKCAYSDPEVIKPFLHSTQLSMKFSLLIFMKMPTITKTCLYNFDPLKPHFYIVKLGFTGVYIIFLISDQNIDCGYSLEPPRRGGSNEYPQSMF